MKVLCIRRDRNNKQHNFIPTHIVTRNRVDKEKHTVDGEWLLEMGMVFIYLWFQQRLNNLLQKKNGTKYQLFYETLAARIAMECI